MDKLFSQFCVFVLSLTVVFPQKNFHIWNSLAVGTFLWLFFIPTTDMIEFSNLLPSSLLPLVSTGSAIVCPAAPTFSSHSQISKAHSPSAINRLSCVLSLSASQSCVIRECDSWAVPPWLVKTANAQAAHESVSQNVGEGSAWGVSEWEPIRCNQRRLFAARSTFWLQQLDWMRLRLQVLIISVHRSSLSL